jgi:hypothetical protein
MKQTYLLVRKEIILQNLMITVFWAVYSSDEFCHKGPILSLSGKLSTTVTSG